MNTSNVDKITTAIVRNNLSALRKLVNADNANLRDEDGFTLLMTAILDEDVGLPLAQFLIDQGAEVNAEDPEKKYTALHFAARDQRREMVEALLRAGAKPDAVEADGNTALTHCVMAGEEPDLEIVKLLLQHGADPKKKNREGESALDVARFAENDELLTLLKTGAGAAKSARLSKGKSVSAAVKPTLKRGTTGRAKKKS